MSSKHSGALAPIAVVIGLGIALGGCAGFEAFDTSGAWFAKPLRVVNTTTGYSYSQLGDTKKERPITPNDLVDANGACPRFTAQAAPSFAEGGDPANAPDMASVLGGGVAIGMSECEVVSRLGQPNAVNLGRNPNGDRAAVLTFNGGARPGVYRFAAGRLSEMDRVETPLAQPTPQTEKKKVVKKRPDKTKDPATANDKT
jgi:hypothetical protein